MGESPITLLLIGLALLAVGLVLDPVFDALRWSYWDPTPIPFFGSLNRLRDSIAMLRGLIVPLGWALTLFGVARVIASGAGAGGWRAGRKRAGRWTGQTRETQAR